MRSLRRSLFLILLVSFTAVAEEGSWQGYLQDGSRITIDPTTNKVTRTQQGETTPLWNGVHRLDNGAVIIVRDGVVVRDETVIEAQRVEAHERLNAACRQLVSKVCGPYNECQSQPACDPARQLLLMEGEELRTGGSEALPESSRLCQEALGNEDFFIPCTGHRRAGRETACERLAARVCGKGGACDEAQSCQVARQLVTMEQQDLFNSPAIPSPASDQCREVLGQPSDFFQDCLETSGLSTKQP